MVRFCTFFSVLLVTTFFLGCTVRFGSSSGGVAVDSKKARHLSDSFMDDFANDRRDVMYSKMEKEFHDITSREKFQELMNIIHDRVGKLTHYEFDHDEIGEKILYNGQRKPTRKIVYQATMTKGTYPLSITVAPNGDELAVTDFLFAVESR